MVEKDYYSKYLKYKQKYLKQKNLQIGGVTNLTIIYYQNNIKITRITIQYVDPLDNLLSIIRFNFRSGYNENLERINGKILLNMIKFEIKNNDGKILDNGKNLSNNEIKDNDVLSVYMTEFIINIMYKGVTYLDQNVNCLKPINDALKAWLKKNEKEKEIENFNAYLMKDGVLLKLDLSSNFLNQLSTENATILIEEKVV